MCRGEGKGRENGTLQRAIHFHYPLHSSQINTAVRISFPVLLFSFRHFHAHPTTPLPRSLLSSSDHFWGDVFRKASCYPEALSKGQPNFSHSSRAPFIRTIGRRWQRREMVLLLLPSDAHRCCRPVYGGQVLLPHPGLRQRDQDPEVIAVQVGLFDVYQLSQKHQKGMREG